MKEKTKNIILYSIGSLFSLILIISIIIFIKNGNTELILWTCYIGLFLISIGIFRKNSNLILSQIIIIAIPNLIWTADVLIKIFTGTSVLGAAPYMFNGIRNFGRDMLSLFHMYTVPLSIWAIFIIKLKKDKWKALIIATIEVIIIFIVGISINFNEYINCLPYPKYCVQITFPGFIPYYVWWWMIYLAFVLISYFTIIKILKIKLWA